MTAPVLVVYDDELGMDFGSNHPANRLRHRATIALCRAAGLLEGPAAELVPGPPPLTDDELHRTFAPAFVRAIRRYSADPVLAKGWDAAQWGIDADNGAYAGMHAAAARLAAASALGARAVAAGPPRRAFVPAGGTHHGLANRASGFGIYNDGAVAINALLDSGMERVAYVDLDVHHGNGTQWIFYDEPRVLTVSVHESGRYLFPGSGFPNETGGPLAPGTSANVALPPFAGNAAIREALEGLVAPLVRAFRPDALVTQCGVDTHHLDPLAHLQATIDLYPWLWRRLRELDDEAAGGRWLALGGGGYGSVMPRAWALLLAEQMGREPEGELPAAWRDEMDRIGFPNEAREWLEDGEPAADEARDARAAELARRAIAESRAALAPFWGDALRG